MKSRVVQIAALAIGMLILLVVAFANRAGENVSTYSTFDTGVNGFEALYNVLAREGVPVARLTGPFDLRDSRARVVAFAAGEGIYDDGDIKRFKVFQAHGGSLVFFGGARSPMLGRLRDAKLHVRQIDAALVTNGALARRPQQAIVAYDALAGRGLVLFDERLQGYDESRSMWSVMPAAVRAALWVVVVAVLIVLVDANVRFAPAIVREPPPDRDSSAYVRSMASLLRRAHAGAAALRRFSSLAPENADLRSMAAIAHPSDAQLLRAAHLFQQRRKERS